MRGTGAAFTKVRHKRFTLTRQRHFPSFLIASNPPKSPPQFREDDLAPCQPDRARLPRHGHGCPGGRSGRPPAPKREEEARTGTPHQRTVGRRLNPSTSSAPVDL